MKSLTLILAFLPLIAFSLLSRLLPHGYIGIAGLAAALIALIAIITSRPVWPPKILNAALPRSPLPLTPAVELLVARAGLRRRAGARRPR